MQQAELGMSRSTTRARKAALLSQGERVVRWVALEGLIDPHTHERRFGRPTFVGGTMLRIRFLQQRCALSGPAMGETLRDVPRFRVSGGLSYETRLPDESTILRIRHLLDEHKLAPQILRTVNEVSQGEGLLLKVGGVVEATLIAAPRSVKNANWQCALETHQTMKRNQWHIGVKAHVGVVAGSGLVHTVTGTSANIAYVAKANNLLHRHETTDALGDAGCQGAPKRPEAKHGARRHRGTWPGKRRALDKSKTSDVLIGPGEHVKASIRGKVEHPSRVIQKQMEYCEVRHRGLRKNIAQLMTPFALSNLWMVRKKLLILARQIRPEAANAR